MRSGSNSIEGVEPVRLVDKGPSMNRFFSKLDLREIRIDPRSSRFGPDEGDDADMADDADAGSDQSAPPVAERATTARAPYIPSWRPTDATTPHLAAADTIDQGADQAGSLDGRGDSRTQGEITVCDDVLKVSARSRPSAVAGAIAGVVREAGRAEVQAIGAGATNQAVKAVAIARDYLQETGIEVICLPAFIDVTIGDEDRTAIRLVIEPR